MRLRKYNKSLGWLSLFAGTVLLSGCNSALLDPKGQIGLEQRSLILTAFGLMLIVVIPAILMAVGFACTLVATRLVSPGSTVRAIKMLSTARTGHTPIKWKLWSGRYLS